MLAYLRDILEGLLGGFIFCFLGFGTGGGLVKAAHELRIGLKRKEPSVGMCAVLIFCIIFYGFATAFLFGLPVFIALESGADTEPTRLALKGFFYYVGGGLFIWSFLQQIPQVWEDK